MHWSLLFTLAQEFVMQQKNDPLVEVDVLDEVLDVEDVQFRLQTVGQPLESLETE